MFIVNIKAKMTLGIQEKWVSVSVSVAMYHFSYLMSMITILRATPRWSKIVLETIARYIACHDEVFHLSVTSKIMCTTFRNSFKILY